MAWVVEYTDAFGEWWEQLDVGRQEAVAFAVRLLEERGPQLGYPYSSRIQQSEHAHMRELRVQHAGQPHRILYAFDPRRVALLLYGGEKTGDERWYDKSVPVADRLYQEHLDALEREP